MKIVKVNVKPELEPTMSVAAIQEIKSEIFKLISKYAETHFSSEQIVKMEVVDGPSMYRIEDSDRSVPLEYIENPDWEKFLPQILEYIKNAQTTQIDILMKEIKDHMRDKDDYFFVRRDHRDCFQSLTLAQFDRGLRITGEWIFGRFELNFLRLASGSYVVEMLQDNKRIFPNTVNSDMAWSEIEVFVFTASRAEDQIEVDFNQVGRVLSSIYPKVSKKKLIAFFADTTSQNKNLEVLRSPIFLQLTLEGVFPEEGEFAWYNPDPYPRKMQNGVLTGNKEINSSVVPHLLFTLRHKSGRPISTGEEKRLLMDQANKIAEAFRKEIEK